MRPLGLPEARGGSLGHVLHSGVSRTYDMLPTIPSKNIKYDLTLWLFHHSNILQEVKLRLEEKLYLPLI